MQATATQNGNQIGRETRTQISVVVEHRYLAQAQPAGLMAALNDCGCTVDVIDTSCISLCASDSLFSSTSVVIARGRDWPTFSLLRSAELAGATVINSASAVASVFDKARMAVELAAADIPTPKTWIGSPNQLIATLASSDLPLVIKPVNGDNGCGIRLVQTFEELVELGAAPLLAQKYVANDGFDLKVYCIGDESWLVRKAGSCAALGGGKCEPQRLPMSPEFAKIADQCRLCFGLELFGVDCILTPAGPVVIEVNEFPNYSGVPHASELLAEYVRARVFESGRL